ncbi:xylulokinase [Oceanobacillus alkalisoli]|uniref:xylulokinase n=1 Tax=Oceanobacillus alkalisoli TaxID=2925113 RepID=UPI001EFF3899|nr:FGGY family carbohydrate kinase [Oceanobacillus alkalisoli]MCF3942573.1 xylulose kinase [Oceanobacillus alkalisoli]
MSHIIGIDIGTSGIKVGAVDKEANLTFFIKQSYSLLYPESGWVELNFPVIWKKVKTIIEEMIKKVSEISGVVDAISLSTFCNSSVHLDARGKTLSNGIIYLDRRSITQAKHVRETLSDEYIFDITRNRLEPGMYTVTSLLWMKANQPEIYNNTDKWGNLSTYILYKLTGEFVMDWTQASYTGLYNVIEYKWSDEICELLGVSKSILPEVVSPFEIIGNFKGIPVVAGAADTACSSFSLGLKPSQMFESVGTSNVLTVCTDDPGQMDRRFLNRCYIWKGQWLSHGAMSTPGASVDWFYRNFLENEKSISILEKLPNESEIGSNGVFFLPYMLGERSPIWDPNARGVFAGLQLTSSKADMLRAIYEGAAFGLRQLYEIIEKKYDLQLETFPSIGGGSKNKIWAQIKANVLKKEIEIKEVSETGVYGSCLIAGKSIGFFDNLDIVKNKTVSHVIPEESTFVKYDDLYYKFNLLYPAMKDFFQIIAK